MNRFFYWSIYGGTLLLSALLMAASVMAVVGFVPFRLAQPILASPADGVIASTASTASTSRADSRSDLNPSAAAGHRDDADGWDAIWQAGSKPQAASSAPAAAGQRRAGRDNGIHRAGGSEVDPTEATVNSEPDEAIAVAGQRHADRSAPTASSPSVMPPSGESSRGGPLVVAGLWPGVQPNTQPDPPVEDPAENPDLDEPRDGDQGDAGGGNGGDAGGDPPGEEAPKGPLRLSLVPGHDEVAAGEMVSVSVVLSEADRISSVPFHVRFNSEVLEYVGAKNGPAIVASPVQPILLAAVNPARPDDLAVGLALVRSSGRFSGSGTVVVLDFRALQAGQSDLLLENASVRDTNSRPLAVQIENAALSVR